jgi:hypothetical protein
MKLETESGLIDWRQTRHIMLIKVKMSGLFPIAFRIMEEKVSIYFYPGLEHIKSRSGEICLRGVGWVC